MQIDPVVASAKPASSRPVAPELPRANRVIHIPDFTLDGDLTTEQSDFFETFGFIRFKRFVAREVAQSLYGSVLEIDRKLVADGREKVNGVPLIFGKSDDGTRYVQRIPFASLQSDAFHTFLQDPRFTGITRTAGPGYRIAEDERDGLVINRFRNEPGAKYKRLGWHTDSLRDLFYFEKPRRYLNVGFYLTDLPGRRTTSPRSPVIKRCRSRSAIRPARRQSQRPARPCDGRASLQTEQARTSESSSSRRGSSGVTKRSSTAGQTLIEPLRKSLVAIFTLTQAGRPEAKAASSAGPMSSARSTYAPKPPRASTTFS